MVIPPPPLAVNTARPERSIWQHIPQKTFRENVEELQKYSNNKPGKPIVHSESDWRARIHRSDRNLYALPFEVEQRIADDLAYIVATKKDAKAVSATTLEEAPGSGGLIIRVATNAGIEERTSKILRGIFDRLEECARKNLSRADCVNQVFDFVVDLDRTCLHGRIQSKRWIPPSNRNGRVIPLETALERLLKQSRDVNGFAKLSRLVNGLCTTLRHVQDCPANSSLELESLKDIVKQCHALCTPDGRTIQETLTNYGFKPEMAMEISVIKQLNKIGRYFGLCEDLVQAARKYGELFRSISLQEVPRYDRYRPHPMTNQGPTTYWVHAEIQILSFYDLHPDLDPRRPRIIGVSKGACYLCNLFILEHQQFFFTKTHGKLYPMWTFPDLRSYSDGQCQEYGRILKEMNAEFMEASIREQQSTARRPDPMESYICLTNTYITSPLASDAGTIDHHAILDPATQFSAGLPQRPYLSPQTNLVRREDLSPDGRDLSPADRPISVPTAVTSADLERLAASDEGELVKEVGISPHSDVPPNISRSVSSLPASAISAALSNAAHLAPPQELASSDGSNHTTGSTVSGQSTTLSAAYPVHKELTASYPFHTQTGNLSMTFEIEGTAQAIIQVGNIPDNGEPILGHVTNVLQLRENETREFNREDSEDSIMLRLQHSYSGTARIELRWL